MKEVIYLPDTKIKKEKPVEFTHFLSKNIGYTKACFKPNDFYKVVYLGKCGVDEDEEMFAAYSVEGNISIYKGYLNSGKY